MLPAKIVSVWLVYCVEIPPWDPSVTVELHLFYGPNLFSPRFPTYTLVACMN